jgi:hypothetical protein
MAKWMRFSLNLPRDYGPLERQAIAQEVIDFIVKRTRDGKNIDGRAFPGYSKAYKDSFNYKFKSGGTVDLTLSGEMLDSIKLISQKPGKVIIGFDRGDNKLNGKAEGNQLGTYGSDTPKRGKARPFLGIKDTDLKAILKKYPPEKAEERATETLSAKAEAGDLADGIDYTLEVDDE